MRVSVIIPNYNRAEIIADTISNMLSQTLAPHEVIVVDDGSTDSSVEVIRSFGNKVILIQQENKGPGAARNAGLKVATGEFIQFMDSDDLASLNKLEVQAHILEDTGADIVYGPWVKVWIRQNQIKLENVVLQQKKLPETRSPLLWFLTDWSMVFQQCLLRKSVLDKVGGYREDMKCYEDADLFVRILLSGGRLVYEDKSLTFYRLDDYGKLTASGNQQLKRLEDRLTYYNGLVNLARSYPVLDTYFKHPQLRVNLLEMRKLASKYGLSPLNFIGFNRIPIRLWVQNWLNRKKKGFQQRLVGHRWPGSFRPGKLNEWQISLVGELGWKIERNK